MKISGDQKKEIRRKIISSAVDVMTEKSFQGATMKEIAERAGIGTATVYNYFASKEKILYSYFAEKHENLKNSISEISEFSQFTLKEKLQTQLETLLEIYLPDRDFVKEAYRLMLDSPLRTFSEFAPVKDSFVVAATRFIDEAVENGEIPEPPLKGTITRLYWDYVNLVIHYWLQDETEGFTGTSQLIDLTLDVVIEILHSGIINKSVDVLVFLFRSHLYGNFQSITRLFREGSSLSSVFKDSFGR